LKLPKGKKLDSSQFKLDGNPPHYQPKAESKPPTQEELFTNFLETVEDKTVYGGDFYCPFCFSKNHISRFLQTQKSGKLAKMLKCPVCHEEMRRQTLTQEMTTRQYAEFLYGYIRLGGYHKIHWDKLKDGLYQAGIAKEFWELWPIVKNEYKAKMGELTDDEKDDETAQYYRDDLIQFLRDIVSPQHCNKISNPCHYNVEADADNKQPCDCNCNKCLMAKIQSSRAKDVRRKDMLGLE
jgi:hypothetical protein